MKLINMKINQTIIKDPIFQNFLLFLDKETELKNNNSFPVTFNKIKKVLNDIDSLNSYLRFFNKHGIAVLKEIHKTVGRSIPLIQFRSSPLHIPDLNNNVIEGVSIIKGEDFLKKSIHNLGIEDDSTFWFKCDKRKISELLKIIEKQGKADEPVQLYLSKSDGLWREPKSKYCYPLEAGSYRYKIINSLVKNRGYRSTDSLSILLDNKKKSVVRVEIGKIRGLIKKYLKIDGKTVIEEGKKNSGYRIHPNCHIEIIDS